MTDFPILGKPAAARSRLAGPLCALTLVLLILLLPNRLSEITPSAFARLPLEALLLGFLLTLPGIAGSALRILAAGLLGLSLILKLADLGVDQFFGRPFNPVLDGRFPRDGMQWLTGTVGQLGSYLAVAALALCLIGLLRLVNAALNSLQTALAGKRGARVGLAATAAVWLVLNFSAPTIAVRPTIDWLTSHWQNARDSLADLKQFAAGVDNDPYASTPNPALFQKLQGKDLMLVFVESYGRTVFDQPDYAQHVRPRLQQYAAELGAAGVSMRSSYLTSPTYGGISWLAHGTLLSGLWINSQSRYDRLVMSRRPTLNRLFQRAGWRTLAVQPAHTLPWPQGDYFGYDRVYAAQDLNYRGQPFNWITMPDQYTLSVIQRLERPAGPRQPVMAEMALISSHAPWTPLPRLVDWQDVGDGSIFNQAREGDTPEAVWQSTERIREQYRKSIEYVLETLVSFVKTYGDDKLVLLVVGDHQPASFVSHDSASHDVPVHLIARDPEVIKAIDGWQWTPGLIPDAQAPVWRMDELRDRLIRAYSALPTL
ncbi:sulfatase-like hydrolase/transferase [Methylomonas koyamae]|uniref:sulfatase-like hydrolase/transferase n=2 Tax=Methylomonas koyamae TaxID=702114 RepID=UPI001C33119B|nr:sulfatase-like hydrolase/transferase [Methylomonas koyamae]BBL59221.1 hypothetical protein MKFW12EY_28340 [Methylomonas koyamae]